MGIEKASLFLLGLNYKDPMAMRHPLKALYGAGNEHVGDFCPVLACASKERLVAEGLPIIKPGIVFTCDADRPVDLDGALGHKLGRLLDPGRRAMGL